MAGSTGDGGLRASVPIASCQSSSGDAGQQPPQRRGPPGADREADVLVVSGVVASGSSVPPRRWAASTISACSSESIRPGTPRSASTACQCAAVIRRAIPLAVLDARPGTGVIR
jgi:hypothetical protein